MNKEHLVDSLLKVLSTKREAVMAVNRTFSAIQDSLKKGEKVVISGFGSFNVKLSPARKCRIPRTNKFVTVPTRYKVKFKPSKDLLK